MRCGTYRDDVPSEGSWIIREISVGELLNENVNARDTGPRPRCHQETGNERQTQHSMDG